MPLLSFAETPARLQHGEQAASTTKIEPVLSAQEHSVATVLLAPTDFARTRVLRVEPLNVKADVYNLTVDGAHEFFANGVLVSNCDCARYAYSSLTHYLSKTQTDKPEHGTTAELEAEAERLEVKMDEAEKKRAQQLADGDEDVFESQGIYDY